MKKIVYLLLIIGSAFAQERDVKPIYFVGSVAPLFEKYTEYNSFSLKAVFADKFQTLAGNGGFSKAELENVSFLGFKKKDTGGDFRIVYNITNFEDVKHTTYDKIPAFWVGYEANVEIYDKEDNLIYRRFYLPQVKSYLMNDNDKLARVMMISLQQIFEELTFDFGKYYTYLPRRKTETVILKKFPKKSDLTDFNQSVEVLEILTQVSPKNWESALQPVMDYWKPLMEYKNVKNGDDLKDIKMAASYNLALAYMALGKTDEVEKLLPFVEENDRKSFGKNYHSRLSSLLKVVYTIKEEQKDLEGIEAVEPEPVLTSHQKSADKFKFLLFNNADIVTSKDGNLKGNIKIMNDHPQRIKYRTEEAPKMSAIGGLASLARTTMADDNKVTIEILGEKKPKKLDLSDIVSITTEEGKTYSVDKIGYVISDDIRYILAEKIKGNNNVVFNLEIFPQNSEYLKNLGADQILRAGTHTAKAKLIEFFKDCSKMHEKINDGTYKKRGYKMSSALIDDYLELCGK